jgi:hypothetical protein
MVGSVWRTQMRPTIRWSSHAIPDAEWFRPHLRPGRLESAVVNFCALWHSATTLASRLHWERSAENNRHAQYCHDLRSRRSSGLRGKLERWANAIAIGLCAQQCSGLTSWRRDSEHIQRHVRLRGHDCSQRADFCPGGACGLDRSRGYRRDR